MSNIEIFKFQDRAPVRTIAIDGEPWFVAKDIAEALGLGRTQEATKHLDDDEKGGCVVGTPSGDQQVSVINESGLYSLILRSRKPEAKAFKRWITHEVLPTIRKTKGAYIAPGSQAELDLTNPDTALEKLIEVAKIAQEARAALAVAEERIAIDKPYVEASKQFFDSEGLYSLRDSARKLGIPPFTFNDILRSWGWIDEKGTAAKAYAVSMGFAENRIYIHPGSGAGTTQGRLTNKGLERAAIKLEKEGAWVGYAAR
ncbi:anti-repressor Ant [Mycobacterium phage Trixie]|uniref:Antirepressor n=1 Tax=Mycobacterium phage Trixie TaxID=1071503 RepID=G1JV28_9CAUD|nr:anti-repressor Ant [Mycobacterium phage Trixie]AEL17890.1 antirepressor [Mycobacterium phage Trixie]